MHFVVIATKMLKGMPRSNYLIRCSMKQLWQLYIYMKNKIPSSVLWSVKNYPHYIIFKMTFIVEKTLASSAQQESRTQLPSSACLPQVLPCSTENTCDQSGPRQSTTFPWRKQCERTVQYPFSQIPLLHPAHSGASSCAVVSFLSSPWLLWERRMLSTLQCQAMAPQIKMYLTQEGEGKDRLWYLILKDWTGWLPHCQKFFFFK